MKIFIWISFLVLSNQVLSGECTCEVYAYAPLTGAMMDKEILLKRDYLGEMGRISMRKVLNCRKDCEDYFYEYYPHRIRISLLHQLSRELIENQQMGFNCTGETVLKYPLRVKAKIGATGLGNVVDLLEVINHEEVCR